MERTKEEIERKILDLSKERTKEEIERKILDLSKELDKHTGSKAHGIRQQIQALNWVIG